MQLRICVTVNGITDTHALAMLVQNTPLMHLQAQQHHFNMPFQLACPGPEQYTDTCESAVVYELELEPGDVVLLATDGVLDNLWDDQIAELVHECLGVRPLLPPAYKQFSVSMKDSTSGAFVCLHRAA